jgi:predicted AAA+ superfamily ATPase
MPRLLERTDHTRQVRRLLKEGPVVALLGARQVGKTTLARQVAREWKGPTTFFDLEDRRDADQLSEPTLALAKLRGLVVIDEFQLQPELPATLRVFADRPRTPARFLILGSASPALVTGASESLAGRVAFHHLPGLDLEEVGASSLERLWVRGGFPRSFTAASGAQSERWRRNFIATFLERDLPRLGIDIAPRMLERFWTMVAHYHGQIWNGSEVGRSFGVSHTAVRKYLDVLDQAFVVTQLQPWSVNVGKRLVKSPKVYVTDSGLLHTLLDIPDGNALQKHPKLGGSWEGFVIGQIRRRLRARPNELFFWATHGGAELDLLVASGGRKLAFEIKRTDAPRVTSSIRSALETLALSHVDIIHAGERTFDLAHNIRAVAARDIPSVLIPLRR